MGARQRAWAKRVRVEWKISLGGRCVHCGCDDLSRLEFHHTAPRRWVNRLTDPTTRIARLREDIARGDVALLCKDCNLEAGEPEPPPTENVDAPF